MSVSFFVPWMSSIISEVSTKPGQAHSQREPRYAALGWTDQRRPLTVIFTVRGALLRVISARDMSRRERRIYEQASSKA
ncbi:MAG: BrnT family toxin [Polyangia bacterium]